MAERGKEKGQTAGGLQPRGNTDLNMFAGSECSRENKWGGINF